MPSLLPYIQGFGTGAGLIVAIGAQNAFVLSRSIRRQHHLVICLVCSLCDALLISLGVLGTGEIIASDPALLAPAAWGGAAFLAWYGFGALRSAVRGGALEGDGDAAPGLKATVLATLAVTLLNPHAYLDTVVMLGAVSGQHAGQARYLFGLGAVSASFAWFFTLGLGGPALAPLFRSRTTWRVLDGLVCATMWAMALALARKALGV